MDAKQFLKEKGISNNDFMDSEALACVVGAIECRCC